MLWEKRKGSPKAALCCRRPADRRHAVVLDTGWCHRFGVIPGIRAGDRGHWRETGEQPRPAKALSANLLEFRREAVHRNNALGRHWWRVHACVCVCVCVCVSVSVKLVAPGKSRVGKPPWRLLCVGSRLELVWAARSYNNGEKQNCLVLFWQMRTIHNVFSLGKCGADRQRHSMERVFGVETVQSWECTKTQRQGLCLFS